MAASAATRAALLGLALLALQRSPAGALGDASPERRAREGPSTNRTPVESQPHHSHHHGSGSGVHRTHMPGATSSQLSPGHSAYDFSNKAKASKKSPASFETTAEEEDLRTPWRSATGQTSAQGDNDDLGTDGARVAHVGYSSTLLDVPPRPGTYLPSNCSTCRFREELKNLSLEAIKEQILNKLGMKHAPNYTGRAIPKIPPLHHLLDLYGMQGDQPDRHFQPGQVIHEEEDDFHAKTTMVVAVAQTSKLRHGGGMGTEMDIQHFKFSESSMRNKVQDASLYIYLPVMIRPVRVVVYRVVGNATEHESMTVLHVASSKFSDERKPSWVELDARKLLIDWFRSPQGNLGVVIKLEDEKGRSLAYNIEPYDHGENSKKPFVKVYTTDGRKHRNKRTLGLNCHETSEETRCCRYPLTVDFEEFGWDWIIAPKKYDANYCSGECPYVFLQKYPHTHIVQQANPAGTAGPCCAPRKMSPISMLYFDNEFNIIYGLLPGMVVDRCGCQ